MSTWKKSKVAGAKLSLRGASYQRTSAPALETPLAGNLSDRILARVSFLAQIVTPILAVLGFYYTVLPLYSKSILEEQVAKSQLELESEQKSLDQLNATIDQRKKDVADLTVQVSEERSTSSNLRGEIGSLTEQRKQAEVSATAAKVESDRRYVELRASVANAAIESASFCSVIVLRWEEFYSPHREMFQGETPAKKGERYRDLSDAKSCIRSKILSSFGVGQLSATDMSFLKNQILGSEMTFDKEYDRIDDAFAVTRDQNVDEEQKEGTDAEFQESTTSMSFQQRSEALNKRIENSVEEAKRRYGRNASIGKEASNAFQHQIDSISSALQKAGWIKQAASK
jgi:hypothetical protein